MSWLRLPYVDCDVLDASPLKFRDARVAELADALDLGSSGQP